MKKLTFALIATITFTLALSSCKSHERCAAYSKINKVQTEKPLNKSIRSI